MDIIEVNNLGKKYKLGKVGAATLREECQELWSRMTGGRDRSGSSNSCDLSKAPQYIWALKGVSFNVERGKTIGIIGLNGAGKSTLLKLISRITEPTEGEITLRGRVASLLEVGTGFHPELTGRENVFLNGAILGMQKAEIAEKYERIVEFSEVGPFIETPVKRYSSGMYVRLAFSVAAHLEPDVMIVDEVLAVGDFAFQAKCIERMRALTQSGKTIVFVSHNLYTLQTLCETGILLVEGRLEAQGAIHNIIAEFKSAYGGGRQKSWSESPRQKGSDVIVEEILLNGDRLRLLESQGCCDVLVEVILRIERGCVLNFGCSIKASDGVYVSGLSTFAEAAPRFFVEGRHRFGIEFNKLNLSSGSYKIAFAIMNEDGIAVHFADDLIAELVVVRVFEFDGVIGVGHKWRRNCSDAEVSLQGLGGAWGAI